MCQVHRCARPGCSHLHFESKLRAYVMSMARHKSEAHGLALQYIIRKAFSYITRYEDPKHDRNSILQDDEIGCEESSEQTSNTTIMLFGFHVCSLELKAVLNESS